MSRVRGAAVLVAAGILCAGVAPAGAQAQERRPAARLVAASTLLLEGDVDSNSPVIRELAGGRPLLHVVTSTAGQPSISSGVGLGRLSPPTPVSFHSHPGHGVWMEAIVADEGGTWYGYYHNEIPADHCGRPDRTKPRIGAMRSQDSGRTWEDLGVILEAPAGEDVCDTANQYFVGGVGDFSVMLDAERAFLYVFFSQYSRDPAMQGVSVARMLWADRDAPVGRVDVWTHHGWLPTELFSIGDDEDPDAQLLVWQHQPGTPLVQPQRPWHDGDVVNDAFWGPAVHWNASLEQYVMLLNRARDDVWSQEGIYVSFSPTLSDPTRWSTPELLLAGGGWYPQVIGLDATGGTDKEAGSRARFFMSGTSNHIIEFFYR